MRSPTLLLLALAIGRADPALQAQESRKPCMLIRNVQVIDGSGSPARPASVRVCGNSIHDLGDLEPARRDSVIDGRGLLLAPGFIDTHSHHLGYLKTHPDAVATASQGITSIVVGLDGSGIPIDSLQAAMGRNPVAVNIGSYTGHTSLRLRVMGEEGLGRQATEAEIDRMKPLLEQELRKGSLGLSTGLEYEGAFYSSPAEVLALARVAAARGGIYASHIRSEDIRLTEALDEIISLGRSTGMPVKVSHIKIADKRQWGTADTILARLDRARKEGVDVTADIYPYVFWNSTLRVLFPGKDFDSPAGAALATDRLFDPDSSMLVRFLPSPDYEGRMLGEVARIRNEDPAKTLLWLVAMAEQYDREHPDAEGVEALAGKSMHEDDVRTFLRWPHTAICSDGNGGRHPRGHGAFTRILGRHVRELGDLRWEEAIHRMTGLAASHMGIADRGLVRKGYFADLVLFDPDTVADRATLQHSDALSAGIRTVWVNGGIVFHDGRPTGVRPGMLLKRKRKG